MIRIENWVVSLYPSDPYTPPELKSQVLSGEVFGHPRFEDGDVITTSALTGLNEAGEVVTLSGSAYSLGVPRTEYEEQFPNAKERVLANLRGKS